METKRFTVEIICQPSTRAMLRDDELAAFLAEMIEPAMILLSPRPRVLVRVDRPEQHNPQRRD
jgi:hypothetical protein